MVFCHLKAANSFTAIYYAELPINTYPPWQMAAPPFWMRSINHQQLNHCSLLTACSACSCSLACQAAQPASLPVLISNDGVVHVERRQCYPRPPEKTACVVEFTSNVQLPKKNLQSYALHMLKYAPKKARICKKKAEESRKYWFHINI